MKIKEVSTDYLKFEGIIEDKRISRLSNKVALDCNRHFVLDDGYFTITKNEYNNRVNSFKARKDLIKRLADKYGEKWIKKHKLGL